MSQTNGVASPPHLGADQADSEGLGHFLRLHSEYQANVRMGGTGAGSAPVPMRCLIDGAYLDLLRMDWLQCRPLDDIWEDNLLTALKREAGFSEEAPSLTEEAPSLTEFCQVVREAARIESRWPIEKRTTYVRRDVQDYL